MGIFFNTQSYVKYTKIHTYTFQIPAYKYLENVFDEIPMI